MTTYENIVEGLRQYADRLGGKGDMMRFLEAPRATLYRALDDENPHLPNSEILCQWLDKMHVQIAFPGEEMDGFVLVPRVKATAGAGESWELDSDIAGMYAFRESFMRAIGIKPKNAIMMYVRGDSMEPLICDHDTILIDTSDKKPIEGFLYVLALGERLMVKRLQQIPNGWNIVSENRNYPPVPIEGQEQDSLNIIGRVRWFGRTM